LTVLSGRKTVHWLIAGALSTIFYGFYGLFCKLSAFENPLVSNLIIYATAIICGSIVVLATTRCVAISKYAFLSGITANVASMTVLYTLASNQVLVVFSFVSFASVVFFLMLLSFERPSLSRKQRSIAVAGILVSVVGLFLASTSTAGGITSLMGNSAVNLQFLLVAPLMPIGYGFWAYFSFVAIKKKKVAIPTVIFNFSFASFIVAVLAYLLFGLRYSLPDFSQLADVYPIIAGLFVMGGIALSLKSYQLTSGESRIEETIVSILANAEIVPLIFISYLILREFTAEAFLGAIIVFVGLSILNFARTR
jgi:drug/metabolite transporter (DMT)-like permease